MPLFSEKHSFGQFVIVFAFEIWYLVCMEHRADPKLLNQYVPSWRRTLLVCLAFTYLFVGLAHSSTCVDHAFAGSAPISAEAKVAVNDGGSDTVPESSRTFGDHCHICSPVQISVFAAVATPSADLYTPMFVTVALQLTDAPRLDPPPPRA